MEKDRLKNILLKLKDITPNYITNSEEYHWDFGKYSIFVTICNGVFDDTDEIFTIDIYYDQRNITYCNPVNLSEKEALETKLKLLTYKENFEDKVYNDILSGISNKKNMLVEPKEVPDEFENMINNEQKEY